MFKKGVIVFGLILLILAAILCLVPVIFQKQISEQVKQEINKDVNASVDYNGLSISLLRNFPNLTISLNDFVAVGQNEFKNDTLAQMKSFGFSLNLFGIITGHGYKITSLNLLQPVIKLRVNKQGHANWDIMHRPLSFSKPAGEGTAINDTGFVFQISNWKAEHAIIEYRNDTSQTIFIADDLNTDGSQRINKTGSDFNVSTIIKELSYQAAGISYLQKVKVNAAIKLSADDATGQYEIKDNVIALNELQLVLKGSFKNTPAGQNYNVTMQAHDTAFKNLLSLIPALNDSNFAELKSGGSFSLSGVVKGLSNEKQSPAFSLQLKVKGGMLQKPGLPKPVEHIYADASIVKPEGPVDSTIIEVRHLHVETGSDSANARLLITTPATNANMQAEVAGNIDLSGISAFYAFEGAKQLSGALQVDLKFKGHKSDIDHKNYKLIQASGYANVSHAVCAVGSLPAPFKINAANFSFHPDFVSLDKLNARAGESDFSGNGKLENVIPYLLHQGRLMATLNLRSDTIALRDFIDKPATASNTTQNSTVNVGGKVPVEKTNAASNFQLVVTTQAGVVYYDKLVLQKLNGRVEANNNGVTVKGMTANLFGGVLFINSHTTDFKNGLADINFQIRVNNMDLQKVYHSFGEAEKSAPWVQHISGAFSGGADGSGKIKSDFNLVYNTLAARGRLQIPDLKIDDMPLLTQIGSLAKVKSFDHLEARNVYSVFAYKNGTTNIDSTDIRFIRGDRIQFKGVSKADQTVDADIDLEVPVKEFGSVASLAQNLLSGFMSVPDNVKFVFKVTGKNAQPVVKLVNVGTSGN